MTMDNVTFVTDIDGNEHAIIDHGNEQFTSMPKAVYEAQQVEHLTEISTGGN
jgi:Tfp pilus tip-associated adhesin PilY1